MKATLLDLLAGMVPEAALRASACSLIVARMLKVREECRVPQVPCPPLRMKMRGSDNDLSDDQMSASISRG